MNRLLFAATLFILATPTFAQTPAPQVDAAAIYKFDPDGGSGIPLTKEIVRAYLAKPIAKPAEDEYRALGVRRKALQIAKRALLTGEALFAPLWEEEAFELQDGSVRPMTPEEKAVFQGLDEVEARMATLNAQRNLSGFSATERTTLSDALCRLLDAGIRFEHRSDGYRKDGADWVFFDWEDGAVVDSRPPDAQTEIALLRYELAMQQVSASSAMRWVDSQNFRMIVGKPF
jgi:hypothetical protein